MQSALFANPPPLPFYTGLVVGILLVIGITATFVASRPILSWHRLLMLSAITLVCGVAGGAAVGGAMILFGDVDPLDRWSLMGGCTTVGTIAGVAGGTVIAVAGLVRRRRSGFRRSPSDVTR